MVTSEASAQLDKYLIDKQMAAISMKISKVDLRFQRRHDMEPKSSWVQSNFDCIDRTGLYKELNTADWDPLPAFPRVLSSKEDLHKRLQQIHQEKSLQENISTNKLVTEEE